MRFAAAVSRERDTHHVARALAEAVRRGLGGQPADLACLFFSIHHAERAQALSRAVREELGPTVLIGCTGEGVIADAEEIEEGAAVTLWGARLPGVSLAPLRLAIPEGRDAFSPAGWPDAAALGAGRPTFLLLADPFSTPIGDALGELGDRYPQAQAIGGLAGGGHDVGENRLLLNDEVCDGGMVGVAVTGAVKIRTVVSQGCRPIGEPFVVTKAEHNVIHELAGAPALERLQAVFESLESEERRLAHRALHLGIVIDEHRAAFERGDFLVRNLIGADRGAGSLAIGDHIQEGQTVQFHLRDGRSASEDLQCLLAADQAKHRTAPLGALMFSCCGRGEGLFGRPHHDASAVRERVGKIPLAGFFAQGEIGPVGGSNFIHGYTASVALFAPPGI